MLKQSLIAVALALLTMNAVQAADLHACRLSSDKKSVTVTVSNPYAQDTSCTVNCHVAIPGGGIASISCTREVPANAKDFVLCTRARDNSASYAKLDDAGNSECVKPLAAEKDSKESDDDDDKMAQEMLKKSQEMLKSLQKK